MPAASELHVNLDAVRHNVSVIRRIIGDDCAFCAMVKADAYGLGAPRLAKALVRAGADMLAVYTTDQAAELARAAIDAPILLLMPLQDLARTDDLYRAFICGSLHITIHDREHLERIEDLAARYGAVAPVHLEIDTGMNRGGCRPDEAPRLLRRIANARRLHLAGVYTHFAAADADPGRTETQFNEFERILDDCRAMIPDDCLIHAANTYATIRRASYHRTMVRVGLAWAGYGLQFISGGGEIRTEAEALAPVLRWTSSLIHIKRIPAGARVGYGGRWTAQRPTVLGLVPVGYADGYPLGAGCTDTRPDGASVGVELADGSIGYVPVIGRVNMDQVAVDLTDLTALPGGPGKQIAVGAPVEVLSPDPAAPNALPRIARVAGTIPHEMICRINPRIRRQYHETRTSVIDTPPARESAASAG